MSEFPAPGQIGREEYAALPPERRSRLRRAWRALASKDSPAQLAATPNGAPFPLRSWPPDAAVDIQHLAEWVDPFKTQGIPRFANAAARDAAIPAPVAGQACYLIDLKQYQGFDTAWYPTGGTMPWAFFETGGSSIPSGWTVVSGLAITASGSGGAAWAAMTGTQLTVPVAGRYLVSATAYLSPSTGAGKAFGASFAVGGTTQYFRATTMGVPTAGAGQPLASTVHAFAAGAVVRLAVYSEVAGTITSCRLAMDYLHRG